LSQLYHAGDIRALPNQRQERTILEKISGYIMYVFWSEFFNQLTNNKVLALEQWPSQLHQELMIWAQIPSGCF
jgi:hypothetical protein